MKKFTLILALALMVAMPTFAERVTSETAQKVAITFFNNNGAKSAQLTDLSKEAGFPNLYIFNAEQGFVVMAADDCVQPILGYSFTGKFVAENMPDNVSSWLQGYNDEIQFAIDSKMKATSETTKMWKELVEGQAKAGKATAVVNNLLLTTWDQDPGYNDLCPYDYSAQQRTVTGCVATAMAQIMKYWEYPNHGVGSHSYTPETHPEYGVQSVNYGATTYDWANMPLSQSNAEVAKLMYHCGVSVDMDYDIASNGGSGAVTAWVSNALQTYFNYQPSTFRYKDDYTNTEWVNMLKAELDAERPLQYSGRGTGGHSFVCCGYDSSNRFYFNWGWSGYNDGFYTLTNLVPGSGGSGGGNYNFTQNQGAIFGIQPVQCNAGEPSNLTYTLDGFTVTLNWTAGEGASSYNIYRNNVLVGNTTGTTDTDNINYGTYSYYVKSKDANGSQSLPSNTVIVSIEPVPTNLTATLSGNNVALTWAEPEWSAPQTGDEILTYGNGNMTTMFGVTGARGYYGHRYPVSMLSFNKVLYKVSFYAAATGSFAVYVYSATSGNTKPQNLLCTKSITASSTGWCNVEFDADEFIHIDNSKDLWVFIYDPEGKQYPMGAESTTNDDGSYFSAQETNGPTSWVGNISGATMLIRTYITDDSFQYNLYDNNLLLASNLSGTTYTVSNVSNNTVHQYTLRTIFNDGETSNSNMAGFALGTASLTSLTMSTYDKMTITENSTLTVSGNLSDENASNLILENGAQLINSSTGVQATVKKNISAYTQDGGWYLLASPIVENITPSVDNGLLANNYDLYTFNQSEDLEWRNIEAGAFTTISNKTGYLYANSGNPTLSFEGTLSASTSATPLLYDANAYLKGFNLIGNPYPCNTYVDRSFYVLNEDGSDFTLGSNPIPPCSAILVQASNANESVTFNKNAAKYEPNIAIAVTNADTRDIAIIDQARISFNEKDQLSKYTLSGQNGKLYFTQNGQDYAVAYANGENEMPLSFKAVKDGTYTLSVDAEELALDYLHLIDNLTGNDVDLLATPSYTFEAKTTDYASRFKLVFDDNSNGPSTGSGTFAYISDGSIIINNAGDATLQIVDMMGRMVVEGEALNRISTSELTPGVYVLRLIDGEMVNTQKIVVE